MSGRIHRDFRKQAAKVARDTIDTLAAPINQSFVNDKALRERIDKVEQWAASFSNMTLWRRLKWLLLGR